MSVQNLISIEFPQSNVHEIKVFTLSNNSLISAAEMEIRSFSTSE